MKELVSLSKLIDAFSTFNSVGPKTAERMGYNVLSMTDEDVENLVKAISEAKNKIHSCPICGLLCEDEVCSVCEDKERDHSVCIVVANAKDALYFEKLNSYHGVYHVLGGLISSVHGVTPENLRIDELKERVEKEHIKELIMATDPTTEGEITALYLARIFKPLNIKISRLAYGMPAGSQLDYVDELTITKALDGRRDI